MPSPALRVKSSFLIEKKHLQVVGCLELLRVIGAPPKGDIDITLDPASCIGQGTNQ